MSILGVIVVLAQVSSPACGSREQALADLARHVAQLAPGRSLPQTKRDLGDSLTVLDSDPATGEAFLLVDGSDQTLHATQRVDCYLDRHSKVVSCKEAASPFLTRYVAQADWERVAKGDSLRSVHARICAPGEPARESATQLSLEYLVILTKRTAYHRSCAGRLLVERDTVVDRELRCE